MRKGIWITAAVAVGALLIPSAVSAATGTFAATSTRAGVTATSTTSQPGVKSTASSTAGKGVHGIASRTGDYATYGVVGHTKSNGTGATPAAGVRGAALAPDAIDARGVWGTALAPFGTGVFGDAADGVGVWGDGLFGVVGSGDAFGLYTLGDVGLDFGARLADFAYDQDANDDWFSGFSGQCRILNGSTSATCPFLTDFGPDVIPVVVVTPTSNPGSYFWVSDTLSTQFDVHVVADPLADVVFNYHVVGLVPDVPLAGASTAPKFPRIPRDH